MGIVLPLPTRFRRTEPSVGGVCGSTLLCLSSRFLGLFRLSSGIQDPEYATGQVSLDAASDFLVGFALGATFLDVFAGFGIIGHPGDRSRVQGAVEPPFAATIQSMPYRVPRRSRDWIHTRQTGESGLAADPSLV